MNSLTPKSQGTIMVLISTITMSMDPIFIRLSGIGQWETAFLFGIFTFMSMTLITQFTQGGVIKAIDKSGPMLLISGMVMGGSGTCVVMAVNATYIANVVMISSTSSIMSAVLSVILLREKQPLRNWAAAIITIIAIFIITKNSIGKGSLYGDLMAVLTTFFVSLNYIIWRKYKNMSRTMVIASGGLFIAIISAFMADFSTFTYSAVAVMLIMGFFTAPLGRVLQAQSARLITATEISLFSLPRTMLAPLFSWIVFSEMPPGSTWFGGSIIILILLCLIYINSKEERRVSPK